LVILIQCSEKLTEIVKTRRHRRVIRPVSLLINSQCAPIQRLDLPVLSRGLVQAGKIAEAGRDGEMILSVNLPVNRQRALVQRLRSTELSLDLKNSGKIIETGRDRRMIRS